MGDYTHMESLSREEKSKERPTSRQNRVFSAPAPYHARDASTMHRRSEIIDGGIGGSVYTGPQASVETLLARLGTVTNVQSVEDHDLDLMEDDVICHLRDCDQSIPSKVHVDDPERAQVVNRYHPGWDYNLTMGDLVKRPFIWDGKTENLWFPDMTTGEKVKRRVYIAMKVKRVSDVNNVTETFRLRFHVYFNWICTRAELTSYRTAKKTSEDEAKPMDWSPEWRPQVEFPNVVEVHAQDWEYYPGEGRFRVVQHKDFAFNPKKDPKPAADQWNPKEAYFIRGKLECDLTLAEQLELQSFPLDCQDLSLIILDRSPNGCIFLPEMRAPKFGAVDPRYSVIDEWDLSAAMLEFHHEGSARSRKRYSRITFRLKLQRRWEVYLWNIVALFAGICALGMTAFAIDAGGLGERLNLLMTLVLTAVAFSYVVLEQLPRVPYVTLMDKYILTSFFFLLSLNLETAFIGIIEPQTDTIWMWIAGTFFIGYHIFFAGYSKWLRKSERAKLKMTSDEVDEEVNMDRPALEMNLLNRYHVGDQGMTLCFTSNVKIPKGLDAQTEDYAKTLDREITRHLKNVHSRAASQMELDLDAATQLS